MRMITHLSYLHSDSINSHMDPKDTSTSYQSLDQVLAIVAKYGKGAYMSKGDVESAFRIVPIQPQDWHLLGIHFNRRFYINICLPFGASISCAIFKNIGNLLQWIAQRWANHPISRYLDDFFTAHILQQVCDSIMQTIHDTCSEVGILMSPSKRVYAMQVIEFLGLLIDTLLIIGCIPADKQRDILQHIMNVLKSECQTAMLLQSLAGKLNFIAKAFPLGRPFIQSLYTAAVGKHPKRLVPVDEVITQDLLLWAYFMHDFKGWLPILDSQQRSKASMTVFTNASANPQLGWGICIPGKGWWSYGKWDPAFFKCYQPSIDFLKMYTILIFINIKKHQLENCYIQFFFRQSANCRCTNQ